MNNLNYLNEKTKEKNNNNNSDCNNWQKSFCVLASYSFWILYTCEKFEVGSMLPQYFLRFSHFSPKIVSKLYIQLKIILSYTRVSRFSHTIFEIFLTFVCKPYGNESCFTKSSQKKNLRKSHEILREIFFVK